MVKLPQPEALDGFVGEGMDVEGTLRFKTLVRVDGRVKGRIESYATLVVGASGKVEADVIVGELQLFGTVRGKVAVDGKVEIHPGGRLEGELHAQAPQVHIAEGGILDGEMHMVEPDPPAGTPEERENPRPEDVSSP